ncbi:MAG: glycosyl hydrolase [Patescibacteria group bacterium]|nr:glycosyl hydrolase [Patescibacteria group bacterium]
MELLKKPKFSKMILATLVVMFIATGIYFIYDSGAMRRSEVKVGAYTTTYGELSILESKLGGQKFDAFLWYGAITQNFDSNFGTRLKNDGRVLQLGWEPRNPSGNPVNQPEYSLKKISNGTHDVDIRKWAGQLKAHGAPVYFRPMSEMNGNWASWCGTVNGNTPTDYVPAWRHIYDIFQEEGASNVKFVWSVNNKNFPSTESNEIKNYFPGDNYIDYVGISGYDHGGTEFNGVFKDQYSKILRLRTRKPIIIVETATAGTGGTVKADWISKIPNQLTRNFPRVEQFYWFSANKEKDWRIDSDTKSVNAFKNMMMVRPFKY